MKLSCMLFTFHSELKEGAYSPADLVSKLHGAGVRAVEPMLRNLEDAPELWADVMAAANDAGMVYSCLDIGANLIGEGDADRVAALDTVKQGLDLCAELDCTVGLIPGSRPAPGMSNDEGRKIYSEQLGKAAELAAPYGVSVCIEDFGVIPDFVCHSSHVLQVVSDAGPEVMVAWDNGNFLLADEWPVDAWPPLRDRTVHVHIKDWVPAPEGSDAGIVTPAGKRWVGSHIGQGQAQVAECLKLMHADGYDGWVSLEVSMRPADDAAVIGAQYLLEVAASL